MCLAATLQLQRIDSEIRRTRSICDSMFEIIDEAVAHNFGEQVEEICLADSGGPGLGSVRQSLWRKRPQERYPGHEGFGILANVCRRD